MLTAIILIVGGILGAASMIVKKKPEAAAIIGKIAPFQGIIGIGMLIWGVIDLLAAIGFMAFGILPLIFAIVEIVLGFLLGFSLIAKFMGEKGEAIFTKIAPMQGIFGIIAILLGILALLANFGIFLIWF